MIIKKNILREETAKDQKRNAPENELLGMMTVKDYELKVEDREYQKYDPMSAYISHFEKCASTFSPQLDINEEDIDYTKTTAFIFG